MDLKIKITDEARDGLAKIAATPRRMLQPLARAFGSGSQEIVGRAVRLRFTGKGPFPVSQNKLGVRTGLLRRSIRATLPQLNASTGEVSVSAGSNVKYYATHEFGQTGSVQVKGHTRRAVGGVSSNSKGKLTKLSQARLKASKQGGRSGYSYVKPHSRRVKVPARAPLGTELKSIQSRSLMRSKLIAAMNTVLKIKS